MEFNTKKFKKNILFFTICILLIVLLSLIDYLTGRKANLKKQELSNGKVDIKKLVINEVMSSNKGVISDEFGNVSDYVEIYNGSSSDINLKGYALSDKKNEIKWSFPDITIKSKEYIVVFLTGNIKNEMHANFKLKSSGGEQVVLFGPNGKVIDAVDIDSIDDNNVIARDEKGKWVIQNKATPNFENTQKGYEKFIESLNSKEKPQLVINEILANNKGNFKNLDGNYYPYIELKNVSDKKINLEDYTLSNDENVSFKWQLPKVTLASGEIILIHSSGKSNKVDNYSTSFKLNSKNGFVILGYKGKVIEKVKYENLPNGVGYIKQNGKFLESSAISPGYENTVDGISKFQKKYLTMPKDLVINEVMNNNYSYLAQNGGNYYDWIELYNNSGKTIKLSDYCLTTNDNSMCTYKLPDVQIKKNEFYIIMASGDEKLSNNKYKHSNIKIGKNEAIYLTSNNTIIDSIMVSEVPNGYSIGKSSSGGVYYFSKPTPYKSNSSGTQAVSYLPTSSVKSGIYNDKKDLTIALNGGSKIYYTLDGSTPTTKSKVYSSPLTIKKTTVLRVMSKESGKLQSDVATYSYIINENHNLPVMSISIDEYDFSVVNRNAWTGDYEKPIYVQLFNKDKTEFEINGGLKLFGGSTRGHYKKSYEIKFKKVFGDAKLKYKVFDDVDSSVFDSLVLRTGSQDEMGDYGQRAIIRDIIGTSLVKEYTKVDVQAYRPIVLYINGKYWGLYFIREKVDETFVANHYNVPADKNKTDIVRIDGEVKSGSYTEFRELTSFISNNSLSNQKNYNKVKEMIDIENFCDFWIAETWVSNNDIVNVRYFRNPKVDNGKWKMIFYDLDSAFYNVNINYYNFSTSASGMTENGYSTFLLRNLMKNSEFKKTYVERLSYNLKNTWATKNVLAKTDEIIKEISIDEFKRNAKRWNLSYSNWEYSIKEVKNYINKRNSYMVSQAKSFFGLSNSEMKKYFGDVK